MHSSCILDYFANLFVHHMVFVGNVHRSPILSHLKGLKVLQQGISELEFYGDLVYRLRKIVGKSKFSDHSESLLTVIKE